jgi:hypothetical protein
MGSGPWAVLWALRRLTLGRAARRQWTAARQSGQLGAALYLGSFGLLWLLSQWPGPQQALPLPAAPLPAALGTLWWCWAWLNPGRRPALGLDGADRLLLQTPAAPWQVLAWPLARVLLAPLGLGAALGGLLILWAPGWELIGLALPPLLAGRPLIQTLAHDLRLESSPAQAQPTLIGQMRARQLLLVLCTLPLAGALQPALLPLTALLGLVGSLHLWRAHWQADLRPAALSRAHAEGLRQGAARLGLPPPTSGERPPRRWPLRAGPRTFWPALARGAWGASLWRAALQLGQQPGRWLAAPLLGAALFVLLAPPDLVLPAVLGLTSLGPTSSRLLLVSSLLTPLLPFLAPPLPAGLPLPALLGRLSQTLPAGVVAGLLTALGLTLTAGLVAGPLAVTLLPTMLTALLLPWAALSCLTWLGQPQPGGPPLELLRLGAALAPILGAVLCSAGGVLWLTPLVLLLLGGASLGTAGP